MVKGDISMETPMITVFFEISCTRLKVVPGGGTMTFDLP